MFSFYHIMEITLYTVINLLPYILLALYPFRDSLRFSKPVTVFMASLLIILNAGTGFIASALPASQKDLLSIFSTAMYFLFYFVSIKAHFGKILFTLLMLSNIANFLEKQNHQLALQKLQYENLTNRISEIQRTKHDLHHHITIMSGYLNDGKIKELKAYLSGYQESLPDNSPIVYCQNYAVNLLLLYFAQQAQNNDIDFSVYADIPAELNIPEIDISVLLGNLLENAIEACTAQPENNRHIIMRYHGMFNAVQKDGLFCVSVLLQLCN